MHSDTIMVMDVHVILLIFYILYVYIVTQTVISFRRKTTVHLKALVGFDSHAIKC